VPAPAQGVLGLQIRNEDDELNDILQKINFPEVQKRIKLERKVLNLLDGGCQLPLGVYCDVADNLYVSFADGIKGECTLLKYKIEVFEGMAEKVISDLKK
jgi:porphobilinogen deaminase